MTPIFGSQVTRHMVISTSWISKSNKFCTPDQNKQKKKLFSEVTSLGAILGEKIFLSWGKKKTNKHKEFWRDAPWWVSRLSRGNVPSVPSNVPSVPRTFSPLNWNCPHKSAQTSRVFLGRPEFIPGTLPGHSDHQIPLCDFSLSVFSLPISRRS